VTERRDDPSPLADRLPWPSDENLTPEQKAAIADFQEHRRVPPFGPFVALLRSPELLSRVRALGDFLRYKTCFPTYLSEFAILIVASHWRQSYEWALHGPIALNAGVAAAHLHSLAHGRRPSAMSDEEAMMYDFCKPVCEGTTLDDGQYARFVAMFGERGAVEATGLVGYYTLLAMVLNTARTPPPPVDERSSDVPRFPV
jgi:4-carboxymuconolactone decarboxylase